jgi:hypothetical protein
LQVNEVLEKIFEISLTTKKCSLYCEPRSRKQDRNRTKFLIELKQTTTIMKTLINHLNVALCSMHSVDGCALAQQGGYQPSSQLTPHCSNPGYAINANLGWFKSTLS